MHDMHVQAKCPAICPSADANPIRVLHGERHDEKKKSELRGELRHTNSGSRASANTMVIALCDLSLEEVGGEYCHL